MSLFLEGFIFGFLGEDASEIKTCAFDAQNITTEFWDAMDNFRSATPLTIIQEYIQGFHKLADVLSKIPQEVNDCKQIG